MHDRASVKDKLKQIASHIKAEFAVYRLVLHHPKTPLFGKILLGMAVGYLLLPFDLIPDFIPVIGHLDEVIIVPGLIYLALRLIPAAVILECREQLKSEHEKQEPLHKGVNNMTEIEKLIQGYKRFHDNYFVSNEEQLFAELAQGQKPSTLVIACSDSRVDPAIVMDSKPGDLFVVRNVANLVPPYEQGGGYHGVSAALEFAVCALGVEHIVVLGHRQCGGIKALFEGIPDGLKGEFIKPWVNIAKRASDRVHSTHPDASKDEKLCECEMEAIVVSLENLATFPWIKSGVEAGKLQLHGWYFDILDGEMRAYDAEARKFTPLV